MISFNPNSLWLDDDGQIYYCRLMVPKTYIRQIACPIEDAGEEADGF